VLNVYFTIAFTVATVTAYLDNGVAPRPNWNSSILAPHFFASALCYVAILLLALLTLMLEVAVPISVGEFWGEEQDATAAAAC
jgi:hypothetical protein